MADNYIESKRPLGKESSRPTRSGASPLIPTVLRVNTSTGAADLYFDNGILGRGNPLATSSVNGNSWIPTKEFLDLYNNRNNTNLTQSEFNKLFAKEYQNILNNDRAFIINKNSDDNVRTELSTKNKIPGVIDPKTGKKSEQTQPTTGSVPESDNEGPGATGNSGDNPPEYSDEQIDKYLKEESGKYYTGTRLKFESIRYPQDIKIEFQDYIKFTIVNYRPSGLLGFNQSSNISRSKLDQMIPVGNIILPIPGNIQDSNTVNWSSDNLNPFKEAIGTFAKTAIGGGNVGEVASQQLNDISNDSGIKSAIVGKFVEGILGNNNIMQRQYGTIVNPNVELLFNTPELRTFSFSFKLSPREASEAVIVKKIIRNFKQAMSVQRSASAFLLRTPFTFMIEYLSQNKLHPYLNRFKECALTSCSVNYTPEGNYMSFDDTNEPSMVSYELNLTFQELEPVFNDEYGNSDYNNIGY